MILISFLRFFLWGVFFASIGFAQDPLFNKKIDAQSEHNLTAEYHALYNHHKASGRVALTATQKSLLSKYKIIFVGGFLSDMLGLMGEENFKTQIDWLQKEWGWERGVHFIQAPINTFADTKTNSKILSQVILKSSQPVILVGHSKGGLDILDSLVQNLDVRDKVKGVITFQSPFWGASVADDVHKSFIYSHLFSGILASSGGNYKSLNSLKTDKRTRYMELFQKEVKEVLEEIPFIALVGWLEGNPPKVKCPMQGGLSKIIKVVLKGLGGSDNSESDLLVPKDHQVIKGMKFVLMPGIDHLSPVMPSEIDIDKVGLLRTLLIMLLERI